MRRIEDGGGRREEGGRKEDEVWRIEVVGRRMVVGWRS